jgi:hypothetical protein
MRSYRITITDELLPALGGRPSRRYQSPPQREQQARLLAELLLDVAVLPSGDGPWQQARAGGTRTVVLVPVGQEGAS